MDHQPMGGRDKLTITVFGDHEVLDTILPLGGGGTKLPVGLSDRVLASRGKAPVIDFDVVEGADVEGMHAWLEGSPAAGDIVVLSFRAELNKLAATGANPDSNRLIELVRRFKKAGCHVVAYGLPTAVAEFPTANYHRVDRQPAELIAHRLDLLLIELSHLEGISLVDVDRLIGELGTLEHMSGPADYSETACELIGQELLRIIDDYGFFDPRPLMLQLGRDGAAK